MRALPYILGIEPDASSVPETPHLAGHSRFFYEMELGHQDSTVPNNIAFQEPPLQRFKR